MEEMIKVIVKEPGKDPEYKVIKNDFHAMQEIVGGLIEIVSAGDGIILVANEEGMIRDLPYNCEIAGHHIFGTFFLCGTDGPDMVSIPGYVTLSERR